jgi:predicted PurR-regulated permease PerM
MINQKMEISTASIVKFFIILLGIIFVYFIREIVALLFVVYIIFSALDPIVNWFTDRKVPRFLTVSVLYIIILALIGAVFSILIPPLVEQLTIMAGNLPDLINRFSIYYRDLIHSTSYIQRILQTLADQLGQVGTSFYSATLSFFGGVATAVSVLVLSFYLLLDRHDAKVFMLNLIAKDRQQQIASTIKNIGFKMGAWLRGQVVLSLMIGFLDFLGLSIIGVPYALTLGILAAIVEIIPIVGPVFAGTVAVIVALSTGSWVQALFVVILYTVIQQIEAHFLVPKMMGTAVGLSPVIVIIALLIGSKIAGIPGAILAIPVAAGLSVIVKDWQKLKSSNSSA